MTTGAAAAVHDAIERQGFAFVHSDEMADLLSSAGNLSDWNEFAASWNDLALDTCMADGGRYRRRRHAAYGTEADGPVLRKPHQPHYQSRDYNALNGGVERWFEPVVASVGGSETLSTILDCTRRFFESLTPGSGSASFRLRASGGQAGGGRGAGAGTSRCTSFESRRARARLASRRPKASIATAWTTCSCC